MKAVTKKKNKSIVLYVIMVVVAIYGIVMLTKLQIDLGKGKRELAELQAQKEELTYTVQELEAMAEQGRDSDLLERTLRTKFNYVYFDEGEKNLYVKNDWSGTRAIIIIEYTKTTD